MMGPRKHQAIVGPVFDQGGARIPEKLLHGVLPAHPVAAEDLHRIAGHLEGGVGAKDL